MAPSASASPAAEASPGGHAAASQDDKQASGDVGASAVTKRTWLDAPSYVFGAAWIHVGTLYAGDNYFYCQTTGPMQTVGDYYNHWWLATDDDTGHADVWVNAVYVSEGENGHPVPGVPRC